MRVDRHRACDRRSESAQTVVLVLIVVAILGGIAWWMYSARDQREAEAKQFARTVATRLAFDLDRKLLDRVIAPERVARYPPSYRDRIIDKLRGFGRPVASPEVSGDVFFTSGFFSPTGTFRADLQYPDMPAAIYLAVSQPKGWWQIDDINVSWDPPPLPEPPPSTAPASPSPSP